MTTPGTELVLRRRLRVVQPRSLDGGADPLAILLQIFAIQICCFSIGGTVSKDKYDSQHAVVKMARDVSSQVAQDR